MRTTRVTVAALAVATALALTACGSETAKDTGSVTQITGQKKAGSATVLDRPFDKPELVLTDTTGKPWNLREQTKGRPTLIYFGYTNCPDVCPLTMSNIAVAKKALPKADQDKLQVVFVTTDPERDTPDSLGAWLRAQDPSFTGLTGDFATIQAAARSLGIGIEAPKKEADGTVVSMHGAQVIAFSPKTDEGYVLYGEGTTVDDYTKDLPKIIKGENP
ncbi:MULTISPECIES: SCO family protein [Streptomyces]|uniref:SCO family protein n=1 Tax=Streptomyces TaxID=1883 RepID=UPI000F7B77A9|nr:MULTISPECIES: SCO family protein [Streptomyces]RST08451.1 SCO family protein [Streptomyces sp. WAC07149]GLX21804.1 SCO family protein [Streptomyces lavendulae subsp. lavendulae]GLX28437.1 SCO family protein [Streptomyces lavendulae subsp. lavendulae]